MTPSHDFIVVGAGSAGAALASRLSEDPAVSVMLLEAGDRDRHPLLSMPLAFRPMVASDKYNWKFQSEPEPGLLNRQLDIPRGRVLGGTSAINAMIAIRGNRRDYDLLKESGLDGWGYDDVLPYFKKLETNWRGEGPFHGGRGPVHITQMKRADMLFEPLRQAAEAVGIPYTEDPNGALQDGISRMEATIGQGRRASTGRAYLRGARGRPNLRIETNALTARILVEGGRATGVEYVVRGQRKVAMAGREVVLSAGTFNSPQILMLSGIGPADHLRSVGIKPVLDVPAVGQNMSDHPNMLLTFRARDKGTGFTRLLRMDRLAMLGARWFTLHDGLLATNGGTANVFLRTKPGLERPEVQLIVLAAYNNAEPWFPGLTAPPITGFSVRVGPLHPVSRGHVRLRSSQFTDKPRIQYNMFTEPEDMAAMIRGVRTTRQIFGASPMRELIDSEFSPGSEIQDDAALDQVIRQNAQHRAHPVGTCRMGADAASVVDARLRVRGIAGLRVADASVLPEVTSGNTNLPSIMIGEKAADMLLNR